MLCELCKRQKKSITGFETPHFRSIIKLQSQLCTMCQALEADGLLKDYASKALQRWWKKHKNRK